MSNRSPEFSYALQWVNEKHWNQRRKGTQIPYIAHLLAVSALTMEAGGSGEETIAALLHDTLEDCDDVSIDDISARFGDRVAEIVKGLSDADLKPGQEKADWRTRKEAYLAHLRDCKDQSILLVCNADKLHNALSILSDLKDPAVGENIWNRFKGKRDGTLWYYQELVRIFNANSPSKRLAREFSEAVTAMADYGQQECG